MKYIYLVFTFSYCMDTFSQPVINQLGAVEGDSFFITLDTQEFDPGEPGANQTYDFSDFNLGGGNTYNVQNAQGTELGPIQFAESTTAWLSVFPDETSFYHYFDFSENIWREYGSHTSFNGDEITQVYSDPLDRFTGPITFGNSGSDLFSGETLSGPYIVNSISGSANYEVDGYGSLLLTGYSLSNCIRVKSTVLITFTDEISGLDTQSNYTDYMYFVEDYPLPVMHYSVIEFGFMDDPVSTAYRSSMLLEYNGETLSTNNVQNRDLKLFPNPASDHFSIVHNAHKSLIRIFNSLGELVYSAIYFPGNQVDISKLARGLYLVVLETEDGREYGQKLVVE